MFKIITANLNGIRSAASKGFFQWVDQQNPDFLGVQEIKAQSEHIINQYDTIGPLKGYFHYAEKKGYSGVGIYTRYEPIDLITGIGVTEFDEEGRWVEARFDTTEHKFSVISCYFPSGSSSEERQLAKFRFLEAIYPKLLALRVEREFILLGDINIAHTEADLKNWKGNLKNSGFLPEERSWMSQLLNHADLVDVYRHLEPTATESCYTWWSQRGQARNNNVGWRIDYQIATPNLAKLATQTSIYKTERFSDHAPLIIEYQSAIMQFIL